MTSAGPQQVPYHVYDGEVVLVGGTVGAGAARTALGGQDVDLILDQVGRALACLWVCEFTQAPLGPHSELQLSLAVTRRQAPPLAAGKSPFDLPRLILLEPGMRLYSGALWNDAPAAVAYNRELLGLNAALCQANFSRGETGGYLSFRFEDLDGRLIFQGDIALPSGQPFWDGLRFERALGSQGRRRLEAYPWLMAQVMAPGNEYLPGPCEAQAYMQARSIVLRRYASSDARLDFGPAFPVSLDFRCDFLEFMSGFEFVYLPPYNHGDRFNGTSAA